MPRSHAFFDKLQQLRDLLPYLPSNLRTYKGFENNNCPYCDELSLCSDLHACFTCAETSRSADSTYLLKSNEALDCDSGAELQLCYECTGYSEKCFASTYCNTCKNCFSCHFCDTCFGCSDCFGCVELDNKKFCIFNKQYSEAEYKRYVERLRKEPPSAILARVEQLRRQIPMLNLQEFENNECALLAFSYFNTRCFDLSYSRENEDCAYFFESVKCKSTIDGNLVYQTTMCAEVSNSDSLSHTAFAIDCSRTHFSYFCNSCNDCSHCFGCIGLEFKEYYILNKPYKPEEYNRIVGRLLEEFAVQHIHVGDEFYDIFALERTATSHA